MPDGQSPRGFKGDIYRAREGVSASADELKSFIAQFRGKSPQEVMGVIGGSGLVQATIQATVVTILGMVLFTVGPYIKNQAMPPVKKVAAAPAPATKPADTKNVDPARQAAASAATAQGGTVAPPPAGEKLDPANATNKQIMDKLGVGQTKTADPKSNPLENSADDLLKDLK